MQKVADVCAQISGIWSDIAQNLVEIQLFMQTLDPKVSPPTIFTNTVDTVSGSSLAWRLVMLLRCFYFTTGSSDSHDTTLGGIDPSGSD